jgi:predicted transcriptional regulator
VLEEAGLVQVIARRITRGIVSKYYTRTARFFTYDISPEITGQHSHSVDILNKALIELTEVEENATGEKKGVVGFPHTRLSSERREYYQEKLQNLLDEFLQEREDPAGEVYGLCLAYFPAPAYVQETLKPDSENDRLEIE